MTQRVLPATMRRGGLDPPSFSSCLDLLGGYVIELNQPMNQSDFGKLVGISQPAVSDLLSRGVLSKEANASQWLMEYCGNLREIAAGRVASGDLDLATERSALARVQRMKLEIELQEIQGKLIPADLIEPRIKAAMIAAREMWRNEPPNIARQVVGLEVSEAETIIARSFDQFLSRLARLPSARGDDDQPDTDEQFSGADVCTSQADRETGWQS